MRVFPGVRRWASRCLVVGWVGLLALQPALVSGARPTAEPGAVVRVPAGDEAILTVSYRDAARWLERMPAEEQSEQLRDWALWGLAALLDLDTGHLRDALFDQTPLRDPLLWDLSANRIGPGRSLFAAPGLLHILAPAGDPLQARTIGHLLDDHRVSAGSDAAMVVVYEYTIDTADRLIELRPRPPAATDELRRQYGYVERLIVDLDDLRNFLDEVDHLSQIQNTGTTLLAGGWSWPDTPHAKVTAEDLTVLQQGYRAVTGTPTTIVELLTTPDLAADAWGLTISEQVRLQAEELQLLFDGLYAAQDNAAMVDVLQAHEQLILDLIVAPETAEALRASRATTREGAWLNDFLDAFLAGYEADDLWSALYSTAAGGLTVPTAGATEPGFSLDPGPPLTVSELLPLLPARFAEQIEGRTTEAAEFVAAYAAADSDTLYDVLVAYTDFINDVVLRPDESEQAQLHWATMSFALNDEAAEQAFLAYMTLLENAISDPDRPWPLLLDTAGGRPPYQAARYDGGLQGTHAGMTYYYTDLVAKAWLLAAGEGSPVGVVPGFLADSAARTPPGHCRQESENGRLWFGLREEAVQASEQQINLGAVTTRVFTMIDDPAGGSHEIEPSYSFGRGVWFWDRHYLAIADYEPEYHRLDQLLRWSAAIAWLMQQKELALPEVPASEVNRDLRFPDWLSSRPDLKWQFDVPFLEPPGAATEALLVLYSLPYADCGSYWTVSGGISGPSIPIIGELVADQAKLPVGVARANTTAADTTYSSQTQAGTIAFRDGRSYMLAAAGPTSAQIDASANGRKVWSFGTLKVNLPESVSRHLSAQIDRTAANLRASLQVQEQPFADVTVAVEGQHAEISLQEGTLARIARPLEAIQARLASHPWQVAVSHAEGVTQAIYDATREQLYARIGDEAEGTWLRFSAETTRGRSELGFRLAAIPPDGEGLLSYHVRIADGPPDVEFAEIAHLPAMEPNATVLAAAAGPGPAAQRITVRLAQENATTDLWLDQGSVLFSVSSPPLAGTHMADLEALAAADWPKIQAQFAQGDAHYVLANGSFVLPGAGHPIFASHRVLDTVARLDAEGADDSTIHTTLAASGIEFRGRVELAGEPGAYALQIAGAVPLIVAIGGSAPTPSYTGDQFTAEGAEEQVLHVTAGRSADIVMRRNEAASMSADSGRFVYPFETDNGDGLGVQVGKQVIRVATGQGMDALAAAIERDAPFSALTDALQGVAGPAPLIVLPESADALRRVESGNGRYVTTPAQGLYIPWLSRNLGRPIYADGDPAVALQNLSRQVALTAANTAIVIDDASLNASQRAVAAEIPGKIRDAGFALEDAQVARSWEEGLDRANLVVITAENDGEIEAKLTALGEAGRLADKFVVLWTCGEPGLRSFALDGIVTRYKMTGLQVYQNQLHLPLLGDYLATILRVAEATPGSSPADILRRAADELLQQTQDSQRIQDIRSFFDTWTQLSAVPQHSGHAPVTWSSTARGA